MGSWSRLKCLSIAHKFLTNEAITGITAFRRQPTLNIKILVLFAYEFVKALQNLKLEGVFAQTESSYTKVCLIFV